MAYVRTSNFKMQQNVAMRMYKLKSAKTPYYFWVVMSIVLQVKCSSNLISQNHDLIKSLK